MTCKVTARERTILIIVPTLYIVCWKILCQSLPLFIIYYIVCTSFTYTIYSMLENPMPKFATFYHFLPTGNAKDSGEKWRHMPFKFWTKFSKLLSYAGEIPYVDFTALTGP